MKRKRGNRSGLKKRHRTVFLKDGREVEVVVPATSARKK